MRVPTAHQHISPLPLSIAFLPLNLSLPFPRALPHSAASAQRPSCANPTCSKQDSPAPYAVALKSMPYTAAALTLAIAAASFSTESVQSASAANVLQTNTLQRRYIVTDSAALLRYALPLDESTDPPARAAQALLEKLGLDLRVRGASGRIVMRRDLATLDRLLQSQRVDMLLQVPAKRRIEASNVIAGIDQAVLCLEGELGIPSSANTSDAADGIFPKQFVWIGAAFVDTFSGPSATAAPRFDPGLVEALRVKALKGIAQLEELMVTDGGVPFRIPRRYDSLPRLKGRATVEIEVEKKNAPADSPQIQYMIATLDGFSAPLNAGNFVDLCQRHVYDGALIQSSQRGFYLQFANSEGSFTDPTTALPRRVPMEVRVAGEPAPVYGSTLDEAGLADMQPVLPVTAFASLASFHSVEDVNDASSSMYLFTFESARSTRGNALNGSVSVFGYVTGGLDVLPTLEAGDKIVSARVLSGLEHFSANAE
jgi:peptidylprolyl isomerase